MTNKFTIKDDNPGYIDGWSIYKNADDDSELDKRIYSYIFIAIGKENNGVRTNIIRDKSHITFHPVPDKSPVRIVMNNYTLIVYDYDETIHYFEHTVSDKNDIIEFSITK